MRSALPHCFIAAAVVAAMVVPLHDVRAASEPSTAAASESKPSDSKAADAKTPEQKASDTKTADAKPTSKRSKAEIEAMLTKCSDEADAKGLLVSRGKGAARKAFRRQCMHRMGVDPR